MCLQVLLVCLVLLLGTGLVSMGLPTLTAALCLAQAAAAVAVLGLGLLGTAVFKPWLLGLALALLLLGLFSVVSAACCLLRLWLCQLGLWL